MVAMRTARDLTVALRIKLKMFGVPIDGPADFFCDNESVVKSQEYEHPYICLSQEAQRCELPHHS